MNRTELVKALKRLKVQTGSLACLGCGHEYNCGTHGCAIIRAAVEELEKTKGDKIFKLLLKCNRNTNKPDKHSFVANIENGTVYVECRGFEIYIESRIYGEQEKVVRWSGSTIAAANRLEKLGIDLISIEM